MVPPLNDLSPM